MQLQQMAGELLFSLVQSGADYFLSNQKQIQLPQEGQLSLPTNLSISQIPANSLLTFSPHQQLFQNDCEAAPQNRNQVGPEINLRIHKRKKGRKFMRKKTKLFHVFLNEILPDAIQILPFVANQKSKNNIKQPSNQKLPFAHQKSKNTIKQLSRKQFLKSKI